MVPTVGHFVCDDTDINKEASGNCYNKAMDFTAWIIVAAGLALLFTVVAAAFAIIFITRTKQK
jgi:hypothetical protein